MNAKGIGKVLAGWTLRQLSAIFSLETRAIPTGATTITVPMIQGNDEAGDTQLIAALVGQMPAALPVIKAQGKAERAPRIVRAENHHAAGHRDARRAIARAAHAEFHNGIREGLKARGR